MFSVRYFRSVLNLLKRYFFVKINLYFFSILAFTMKPIEKIFLLISLALAFLLAAVSIFIKNELLLNITGWLFVGAVTGYALQKKSLTTWINAIRLSRIEATRWAGTSTSSSNSIYENASTFPLRTRTG